MKRVLFIQNGPEDGPGLFALAVLAAGLNLEVVHAWRGDPIPQNARDYSGVAFGGGAISAYQLEEYPFLRHEIAFIEQAKAFNIPALGMCLGAQLMAAATGGRVYRHSAKEIGFYEIELAPAAADDPLWNGIGPRFLPVHWHGDTFTLPLGATLLASSSLTANQLFRCGENFYGFQFHLEFDLPVLSEMISSDTEALAAEGIDANAFLLQAKKHLPAMVPVAETVFARWLALFSSNSTPITL